MYKILFVAVFAFAIAVEPPVFEGPCRTIEEFGGAHTGQNGFNLNAYLGTWFEIERYEMIFQFGGECVTSHYTMHPTLPGMHVSNQKLSEDQTWFTEIGRATISFPEEDPVRGMLNITFPDTAPTPVSNYWILRTDYTDYAVVVGCVPLNATHHGDMYWYLSRGYPPSVNGRNRVNEVIDAYLNPTYIRPTRQGLEDCFVSL